ncbi:MAG: 50S ribosomal protein L6 [Kofleriaceae bacterium]|jgi:large subunit ribosomal protein L6|nr:50S ribosomal protein L6 [Kofleriaceae bacterium]MBP6836729.1 50S ribosomal protein L6 [Kofleriaceae bacterium]
MSRIGRKPVEIPKGVQVTITKDAISAKGPKGTLSVKKHPAVEVKEEQGNLLFGRTGNLGPERAAHGLLRALCNNMLVGVTKGFERQLEIIGVGYKAEVKGSNLVLSLGYSHPVEYKLPEGIAAKVDKSTLILSGIDKQALGAAAAKIRSFRPPEPYKGKGIKYSTEVIQRKAGKTAGK